jgi:hypothetical protein
MKNIPTTLKSTSAGFEPGFGHVGIQKDRHACALACLAIISGTTLEDVFKNAEALGMPRTGPYNHRLDGEFLASLGAAYGWVLSDWKEVTKFSQLPDLCIAMVGYDEEYEIGAHVVVHKAKASHDAKTITYIIDPSANTPQQQIRTDLDAFAPTWYIGVHPMKTSPLGRK